MLLEIFNFILSNLLWVFGLFALGFIFFDGNKPILAFLTITGLSLILGIFESASGWGFYTGGFLSLYYVSQMAILKYAEEIHFLKNRLAVVDSLYAYSLMIVYNFILVPWWIT